MRLGAVGFAGLVGSSCQPAPPAEERAAIVLAIRQHVADANELIGQWKALADGGVSIAELQAIVADAEPQFDERLAAARGLVEEFRRLAPDQLIDVERLTHALDLATEVDLSTLDLHSVVTQGQLDAMVGLINSWIDALLQ